MKDENRIIQEVENILEEINMEIHEIVFSNLYKGRISGIAIYKGSGEKFFFKYNSLDNEEHLKHLQKEIEMYRKMGEKEYLPKMIFSSENLLLLEYLEGERLRETVLKGKDDQALIAFFRLMGLTWPTVKNRMQEAENLFEEISRTIDRLIYSKPMKTTEHKYEKKITRVIVILYRKKFKELKSQIKEWVCADKHLMKKTSVHGDLHLNNIYITRNSVYLLDWENYRMGYRWLEVLSAYVQMICLCDNENLEYLQNYCKINDYEEDTVIKIKEILLTCINTNRSFCEKSIWEWLKAEIKFWKMLSQV